MKKTSLYSNEDLHSDYKSWDHFLSKKQSDEIITANYGWVWYCHANCNYFLDPHDNVYYHIFGFHGLNFWLNYVIFPFLTERHKNSDIAVLIKERDCHTWNCGENREEGMYYRFFDDMIRERI